MKKHISLVLSALVAVCTCFNAGIVSKAATVPSNATLLNTYGKTFQKSGVAIPAYKMNDRSVINFTKGEYNSVTAENEMKPDAILGSSPRTISVAQAKSLGYYIPAGYTESTVPQLNFSSTDSMLKTCYENGLTMRGHTLVWHSQTPEWFFKAGYNGGAGYVSQQVMDKRMEMYIKTVLGHVYSSKYKDVIYAWDVVNEYLHADRSGWLTIYGKPNTRAQFVKNAFKYAYEGLATYGYEKKVKLFYNDYNTYMEVNDIISLINFINQGQAAKVCAGIGMQSHLSTNFPSVSYYTAALDAFRKAGFEIQITELDVGGSGQESYCYNLMKSIIDQKNKGANITAVVWWGLSDDVSWRKGDNPLLFSRLGVKKGMYNKVLQAYYDSNIKETPAPTPQPQPTPDPTPAPVQTKVPGETAKIADGWYYIKNVNAGKYLQVAGNKAKAITNVELRTGDGSEGQKWYLKNIGNGYVTLKSGLGEFMLDVANGENEDGANAQIYDAYSGNAQQFMIKTSSTKNAYVIATKCSDLTKVLDDYNFGKADGTNVCQWTYGGKGNQQWIFEPVSDKTVEQPSEPTNPTPAPTPDPTPAVSGLKLDYNVNNWGSGFQVNFKIKNNSSASVNTWTLKLKKSEINITSSWNVTINEVGDYYVITPVSWNANIAKGGSVEFGVQGTGTVGTTLNYILN